MTTLYIMRHGDAQSRAATDAERPLSERGKAESASMVKYIIENPPVKLLVSPYLRAQQTAGIMLSGLKSIGCNPEIQTVPYITPEDSARDAIEKIKKLVDDPVMIVSHNPFVSVLVSLLTDGHAQASISMATASIVRLSAVEVGLGAADLDWYNTPCI